MLYNPAGGRKFRLGTLIAGGETRIDGRESAN
jgi:hypothetical protein